MIAKIRRLHRSQAMTQAIVRSQTPEERDYARYQTEIELRKRHAAERQADLESLQVGLARFEAEYHARVGRLFVDLDQVRLAIDEYECRIARLHADPHADPNRIEDELRQEFAARHAEGERDAEETRRYEAAFAHEQTRPRLDAGGEDEIGRLYRDLARRTHVMRTESAP
jgi:hypothetical protein